MLPFVSDPLVLEQLLVHHEQSLVNPIKPRLHFRRYHALAHDKPFHDTPGNRTFGTAASISARCFSSHPGNINFVPNSATG